ncbi:hypothetical protein AMES_2386 [Amycolatopsis mediterranei S699]|uniref:DUF4192 domain-containing protein n=4 Tax=Amycolatopsis mediterranei TaxID=33910 RepID=A0A0H3CZX5_AMYMU|nr:DUF4192 domain-containing protein [Amycolatopsis mediterranei]ADJ44209.1 conserved hypothetical protein [Amycolatopsis mediterranei U32]AEK40945.1 hypothetical protein RAM_12275 [Amycolatopsis mediterranei S699]AFO75922.1 hypothetical protein AMES_2386 [Amycolatopsis mediterranei S699]AGT83051.1 hypothetical protein B737_2387 [Amycolatopsis mediterranei RB]KDO06874.1 hypothetical protein DV26_32255 [Amycolatopsis mediterranei]
MTTATPPDLRDPAQLLTALPYLIGFRPAKSVVLLGHRDPGDCPGLILRGDLPRRVHRIRQAQALAQRFAAGSHVGVTLVIVGGRRRPGKPPPHAGFVEDLVRALEDAGLPVLHALWTPAIRAGAPWACYRIEECAGVLPDPRSTVVAAAATECGTVAFDSREELEALLAPRSPEALARRADQLSRLTSPPWPEATRVNGAASVVRAAFERRRRGDGPPTDEEAVLLANALKLPEIRDLCLAMAVPPATAGAREAEHLWLTLVREIPPPERAEPATLLGFTAYLRGDGAFAGMALDNALEAAPDHVLASLLKRVLDTGTPPEVIRGLAAAAAGPLVGFGLDPADNDVGKAA